MNVKSLKTRPYLSNYSFHFLKIFVNCEFNWCLLSISLRSKSSMFTKTENASISNCIVNSKVSSLGNRSEQALVNMNIVWFLYLIYILLQKVYGWNRFLRYLMKYVNGFVEFFKLHFWNTLYSIKRSWHCLVYFNHIHERWSRILLEYDANNSLWSYRNRFILNAYTLVLTQCTVGEC